VNFLRVVIDIHEPKEIADLLERMLVPVIIKSITPGDYVIGNIGIERKSVSDFHQSIIKRRIFDQVCRLREAYEKSILIVEGDLYSLFDERGFKQYLGALASIIIDFDTPVIFTRNKVETAYMLRSIWVRMVKEEKQTIVRFKPKIISEDERKMFILQGFPDVGPKLAERILEKFGTLRNFFNASISQLMSIEGIGERKAEEIYKLINTPFKRRGDLKLL